MNLRLVLRPPIAWTAILGFSIITLACLSVGFGKILNFVFPVGALCVGVLLFLRYKILYVGFTWWLFFLTPFVRRLADMQGGFTAPSPILLTPFLVCMLTGLTVIKYLPRAHKNGSLPIIIALLGVFYACITGLIQTPSINWAVGVIDSLSPLCFAFYLYINWRQYPLYKENIMRVFLWGVIVMGAYGIYQYLLAPQWDRLWLTGVTGESAEVLIMLGHPFGTPQPFGIRVWSTMNGPLDFAMIMMTGLCLIVANKSLIMIPASVLGYLSFLLSLARTAWLAWIVGIVLLFSRLSDRLQMRIILIALCILTLTVPVVIQEPFSTVVRTRIESLTNVSNDGSGKERQDTYQLLMKDALTSFVGGGVGNDKYTDRPLDSSLLYMILWWGWIGTIPYFGSMLFMLQKTSTSMKKYCDPFLIVCRAIVFGAIAIFPIGPVVLGVTGVAIWTMLGISMAGKKYYSHTF